MQQNSQLRKRKLIDFCVFVSITGTLVLLGAGLWAVPLCFILSCWNFYDGQTRAALYRIAKLPAVITTDASDPAPGESWVLKGEDEDGCPWEGQKWKPVRILDVRDGWVRYAIGSLLFNDERLRLESFTKIYRRVGDAA